MSVVVTLHPASGNPALSNVPCAIDGLFSADRLVWAAMARLSCTTHPMSAHGWVQHEGNAGPHEDVCFRHRSDETKATCERKGGQSNACNDVVSRVPSGTAGRYQIRQIGLP